MCITDRFRLGCILLLGCIPVFFAACAKEPAPGSVHPALRAAPGHFPPPHYELQVDVADPVALFELGRRLFYDPVLSTDSTISCASCHHQDRGFADSTALSRGVYGRLGSRHSPALSNLAWQPYYMWDGGILHLELMPVAPVTDSNEMAMPFRELNRRLNSHEYYREAFGQIFSSDSISDRDILVTLSQFLRSLVSADSRYDRYQEGHTTVLDSSEQRGLRVFRVHCAVCHREPLMTDYSFRITGTYIPGSDPGRYTVSQDETDRGAYKVPSLRNVAGSAPYMHDGRFRTLAEVLAHYRDGIPVTGADSLLYAGGWPGIRLTAGEEADLLRFLETLTDTAFLTEGKFADPGPY